MIHARASLGRIGWPFAVATLLIASLAAAVTPAAAQTRFVFANESPYDTLDPHAAFDVGRVAVRLNFYDGLYRWLDNPPKLTPWLAESHTVSDNGLVYRFKMKSSAKFHDGSPVTAEDVVYTMERMIAINKGSAILFSSIIKPGTTKALDANTVEFNLT